MVRTPHSSGTCMWSKFEHTGIKVNAARKNWLLKHSTLASTVHDHKDEARTAPRDGPIHMLCWSNGSI